MAQVRRDDMARMAQPIGDRGAMTGWRSGIESTGQHEHRDIDLAYLVEGVRDGPRGHGSASVGVQVCEGGAEACRARFGPACRCYTRHVFGADHGEVHADRDVLVHARADGGGQRDQRREITAARLGQCIGQHGGQRRYVKWNAQQG